MKGCCCGVGECCRACHGNPLQTPQASRYKQGEWFRPDGTLANQGGRDAQ